MAAAAMSLGLHERGIHAVGTGGTGPRAGPLQRRVSGVAGRPATVDGTRTDIHEGHLMRMRRMAGLLFASGFQDPGQLLELG